MSPFLEKLRAALNRLMAGRNGTDELGLFLLVLALILSLVFTFTGLSVFSLLSLAAFGFSLFRILSRNRQARFQENTRFVSMYNGQVHQLRAFRLRLKNRRIYKYCRCPGCRVLIRTKRGEGEKELTCPKCHAKFKVRT